MVIVKNHTPTPSDAVYGLGFVGALWYFISTASSFTAGVIGIIKAVVWPGVLVFHLLKMLGL